MSEIYVEQGVLHAAAEEWRDQADALTVATSAVRNAPTGGFGPAVSGIVTSFIATWSQHGATAAERADYAADNLQLAEESYQGVDLAASSIFYGWSESFDGWPAS